MSIYISVASLTSQWAQGEIYFPILKKIFFSKCFHFIHIYFRPKFLYFLPIFCSFFCRGGISSLIHVLDTLLSINIIILQ